jgi:hypothetical protein
MGRIGGESACGRGDCGAAWGGRGRAAAGGPGLRAGEAPPGAGGRQVAVIGRLVFREWTARDGSKRSAHSVRGRVEFLGPKSESPGRVEPEEMALAI